MCFVVFLYEILSKFKRTIFKIFQIEAYEKEVLAKSGLQDFITPVQIFFKIFTSVGSVFAETIHPFLEVNFGHGQIMHGETSLQSGKLSKIVLR